MGFFKKMGNALTGGLFRSSGTNPANAAMPYMNQIPGIGRQYYEPFINEGQQAGQQLNPLYERMSQDPSQYINALMQNYSPSEGYQFKEQQMLRGAQNSAAAGGFAGTQNDQMGQADMIRGLLGGDMQQYLQNVLGVQGTGMQGMENRVGRGYESAGNLAGYLGNALGAQGGLAYQGEAQRNQQRADKRNSIFNLLGNLAGAGAGIYHTNKMYGGQ